MNSPCWREVLLVYELGWIVYTDMANDITGKGQHCVV